MGDNSTPYAAKEYEAEVRRTIPFHSTIIEQAVDTALGAVPQPSRWLDTGCGTGRLAAAARARAPRTELWLADPSVAMLDLARAQNPDLPSERFLLATSEDLPDVGPFEVITAVQCHHYSADPAVRERALRRCLALLDPGGALVVFENVRAESVAGHAVQRRRWATWQAAQGRSEDVIAFHLAREGTQFFPLRVSEHVALLERVGFTTVEVIWRAYGQAGLLALAPG
jgi:tRNA (cmo5U34)-methyltransferase